MLIIYFNLYEIEGVMNKFSLIFIFSMIILSCSQGTQSNNSNQISSIKISSDNGESAPLGIYSTFSAIGTYNNGESKDLTTLGTWSSSNEKIAKFDESSRFNLFSESVGTTVIYFKYNNIVESLLFTVNNPVLNNIYISVESSYTYKNLYVGLNMRLRARGIFDNNMQEDLTEATNWLSSAPNLATIDNGKQLESKGIVTPLSESSDIVTFKASFESKESSISFHVIKGLKIFVTESKYTGGLGGFLGADEKCNSDNFRPESKSDYKALLFNNKATIPSIHYYNLAESLVAVATTTNLVADINQVGTVQNIINSSGVDVEKNAQCWTGLYLLSSGNYMEYNCSGWTGIGAGGYGINNVTTKSWFSIYSSQQCNNVTDASLHLYCVEKPK
jgi:hypothetical protein